MTSFGNGKSFNVGDTLKLLQAFEARAAPAAVSAAVPAAVPPAAVSPAVSTAVPAVSPAVAVCSNGHPLLRAVFAATRVCDVCGKDIAVSTPVFACKQCEEDVCQACTSGGKKLPRAGVEITETMAAASAVCSNEIGLLADACVDMVVNAAARSGNGNAAICPTGLAVVTLLLQAATLDQGDKKALSSLVGVTKPEDVARATAGQVLDDPTRSIHGAVMVMAPDANPEYVELVRQVAGDAGVVREDFDRQAADDFVCEKTCGLIEKAFTGDLPQGNVNLMITMVNAFAGRWDCKRESLPDYRFDRRYVKGVKFVGVRSALWDHDDGYFKGAAVPFQGGAHVFCAFIQPLGSALNLYDALRKVLRGESGCKYNVEVPEFGVESNLNLKEHTGTMKLQLIAPGAELAVFQQQVSVKVDVHGAVAGSATTAMALTRSGGGPRVLRIDGKFFFCIFRADPELGVVPMFVTKVSKL